MRIFVRLLLIGFIRLIFIMGCGPAAIHTGAVNVQAQPAVRAVPGEVIVQFRAETAQDRIDTILAATGTRIKKNLGMPLIFLLSVSGNRSDDETIRQLLGFAEVLHAEPNRVTLIKPGLIQPSKNRKSDEAEKNLR